MENKNPFHLLSVWETYYNEIGQWILDKIIMEGKV